MIWSSCLEPVPPMRYLPGPASLTALVYSTAVLYGVSACTHSRNWSRASILIGVRSLQLNGMPVAIGVVNTFDSVMISLWASFFAFLTYRKPSAPAPPDLLTTTIGCFIRSFLTMTPWMKRAIWSAPPPLPAGTIHSTGLVGSQALAVSGAPSATAAASVVRTGMVLLRDFIR